MSSKRSHALLNIANKNVNNQQIDEFSTNETEEQFSHTTVEKHRFSPLPPGADVILSSEEMQGVWADLFSRNDYQEESVTVTDVQDKFPATTPVQVHDVITEDAYMPTEPMTPENISECPQSLHSQHDQESPMPLTPIFSNLLDQPTPLRVSHNNNIEELELLSAVQDTPVPSPVNRHAKCDDPFCCLHGPDEYACSPLVDTLGKDSNHLSSELSALLKNRGKKRVRNSENWGDIKRKTPKNQGKTYCSKRGRTVDAKTMGPPCQCKFQCASKISEKERVDVFTKFWELGVREQQWLYVANYNTKQHKARTFRRELKHQREINISYQKKTMTMSVMIK